MPGPVGPYGVAGGAIGNGGAVPGESLPRTGTDPAVPAGFGLVLLATGFGIIWFRRRLEGEV